MVEYKGFQISSVQEMCDRALEEMSVIGSTSPYLLMDLKNEKLGIDIALNTTVKMEEVDTAMAIADPKERKEKLYRLNEIAALAATEFINTKFQRIKHSDLPGKDVILAHEESGDWSVTSLDELGYSSWEGDYQKVAEKLSENNGYAKYTMSEFSCVSDRLNGVICNDNPPSPTTE